MYPKTKTIFFSFFFFSFYRVCRKLVDIENKIQNHIFSKLKSSRFLKKGFYCFFQQTKFNLTNPFFFSFSRSFLKQKN
jgi:hypothetical protein